MFRPRFWHFANPLPFLLLALVALSGTARASFFEVDRTDGTNVSACTAADNDCTLRGAISAANGASDADTITFDGGVFAAAQAISLDTALPTLSTPITITGPGANLLTVKATSNGAFHIFTVASGVSATLSGLTISNGIRGINNSGTLTVTICTLSGNTGVGINNASGATTATNCTLSGNTGGGIYNNGGTVTATNCTLSGNTGDGIYNNGGATTATNCTLSGNSTGITSAGGTTTATNCTLSGNSTGIRSAGGTTTLQNTLCAGNTTNTTGTITDGGNNITSGTAAAAGLDPAGLANNFGPTQTIALLAGGTAINAGSNALIPGGITTDQRGSGSPRIAGGTVDIGAFELDALQSGPNFVVNVTNDGISVCGVEDCSLGDAITAANANADSSVITFTSPLFAAAQTISLGTMLPYLTTPITITGPGANLLTVKPTTQGAFNIFTVDTGVSATLSGLTISNGDNGILNSGTVTVTKCTASGNFNGIFNFYGTLTASNCTLNGNTQSGLQKSGSGTLTATNCTVSGNVIGIQSSGTLTATNCTVSGNYYGISAHNGTRTLNNTLCAGNTEDISGTITAGGNNITSGTAAEAGLDPNGLQDNGGPTQTIALLPGSTAINAGDNALIPAGITTDQRGGGFPRIQGGTVDIGAFEALALTINDVTVAEGNSGNVNAVFTATLSAASTQTVTVNYATANGTAQSGAPADYGARTGTLTFAPGQTSKTITVPVVGDTRDEVDETFVVNLSGATNATVADGQGQCTITDDDAAPSLSIGARTVTEGNVGNTNVVFTVTLSEVSGRTVTVNYATANGTAQSAAPTDYGARTGTLTFAPGQTSKTITVPVVGDIRDEVDETFFVNLSGETNATVAVADAQGQGTITDDDAAPSLSIGARTVTEGNVGNTNVVFTVTLSEVSGRTVTVNYATANGTAQSAAPTDYGARTGMLTFAPGQTSKTITVPVVGDIRDEVDETFFVNLSGEANATVAVADAQGQGTITDDDAAPSLSIGDITKTEGNVGNTNAVFTVTLSAVSGRTVTVNYATANGTAQSAAPTDYGARTGTLTFAPGQTSKTISVPVVGDTRDEDDETFMVNLSGETNATVADAQGQGTITDDDAAPSLSIGDITKTEGNVGNTNAVFTVTLSAVSGKTVTVNYATANGTAQSGAPTDYGARTGTLTFAPGQTSKTISVPVVGDTLVEVNETFFVNLSAATNATIADGQGLGTITNDDVAALLFEDDEPSE